MKNCLRYTFILVTFLLAGCTREVCKDLEIVETSATLIWTGDYALDGCGYRIQVGEQMLKPENEEDIDKSFKTQEIFTGSTIKLKYIPRGKRDFQCGMLPVTNSLDFIRVISIEKI